MKLAMPVIVIVPGIAAYVLYKNGGLQQEMSPGGHLNADNAYSAVLGFLPTGFKGLSVAALTAAIVASLAGKANSISTIFTLDIYKKHINKQASEKKLVSVGRVTILAAMVLSVLFTWQDFFRYRRRRRLYLYTEVYRLYQPRYLRHIYFGFLLETYHRCGRYCRYINRLWYVGIV
jgi:uncharacterized sodium:solute symporter family permease YidK